MSFARDTTTAANRLLALLQQIRKEGVHPGNLKALEEAADLVAREHADLAAQGQIANADAEAARADAAATRAEADKAIKALAESEQRYRYMGETIPFGVWWCNPKGEAEYVSPSFCELLNMTLEEQQKFGWMRRLVPEDRQPMLDKWMHTCATGIPWDHEHRIIDRHGKVHTVLSRGLPVRDDKSQIVAWVGVNLDITERKRIELQLKEAKEALEQAIQVKDQFLANISHELRTPLTLILGPLRKLLTAGNVTDEQRHDMKVMERNARTLLKNVNDLLDLSRLDAGRMRIEYSQVDLARMARFVASHFESVADDRRVSFAVKTPDALPAQVDSDKLQRVLFNLLSNAFKFTPVGGSVRLHLHADQGQGIVSVQDTGPGVPPEMRQIIFERFRQAEGGATRRHGGTGLGLAIVREFVTLHHGSVRVEEAPGGGATFVVELPLAAPEGVEIKCAPAAADEDTGQGVTAELRTQVGLRPKHMGAIGSDAPLVLVVEDNPEMNAFVAETLGERFRVVTACDGQEGVEKALALTPDLVVSDIMMPRMSGEDLVREVRCHKALEDVPILLLTAKADENLRVGLLSRGAQDCLVKPFLAEELVARADGLISRKRRAEAALRESYSLLRAVTEGVDDAIFVKDAKSRYLMINAPGALRLGKSVEEVLGHDDRALTDADTAAQIHAADQRIIAEGRTLTFEEQRTVDGVRRTYHTSKGPHRDGQGRIIGVLGISHDITERKQAEEELRRLYGELEQRVEQRTTELAVANRELEAFAYTVSHDLRAPLRHIMGFVGLLSDHAGPALDDESRDYVRTISQSAERMGQLIDDLLALSRLGRAAMNEVNVDLAELAKEAREELTSQAKRREIEWRLGPLPQVRGDRTLLRNVMVNLLSNAIKYSRQRDQALIEVGRQDRDGEVVCYVRDNGAGFDMKFAGKLFGVFQRLHPAQKFEGTGVGLASVRRIIERHGGRVWAEGVVDQGATFYFALPRERVRP